MAARALSSTRRLTSNTVAKEGSWMSHPTKYVFQHPHLRFCLNPYFYLAVATRLPELRTVTSSDSDNASDHRWSFVALCRFRYIVEKSAL